MAKGGNVAHLPWRKKGASICSPVFSEHIQENYQKGFQLRFEVHQTSLKWLCCWGNEYIMGEPGGSFLPVENIYTHTFEKPDLFDKSLTNMHEIVATTPHFLLNLCLFLFFRLPLFVG